MDVERLLLSKVLASKDINTPTEAGITPDFFQDVKSKQVFRDLLEHKRMYGQVPTLGAIRLDHPDYKFIKAEDSLEFLVDKMREARTFALLEQGLAAATEAWEKDDHQASLAAMAETMRVIASAVPTTRDVDITMTGLERLEAYYALKDTPDGLLGIPTGFQTLDRATQGLQDEELITFVGPPKAGKSTIMLLVAMAAWAYGLRPLFFTFEMSDKEMTQRLDAIRAGISHARLRNASLKKDEWQKLEKMLRAIDGMPSFIFSSDSNSATTLSGIGAKVDNYKPDILFVDGMYMLQDEEGEPQNSPQALTNLTRGFKRMAQNRKIPVAISTQVLEWKMDKKKGITSSSIGYSSSFAQDSNTIIGVEKTDDPDINKLKIVLSRNAPPTETYVQWDWETGAFEELASDPFADEAAGGGGDDAWGGDSF